MQLEQNGTKEKIPIITGLLIIINVVVYIITEWNGSSVDADYMIRAGAMYEPAFVEGCEYYRLISHFFLHFGFDHLINNMISLLVLGYALENDIGRRWFTLIYMFSGIFAGLVSVYVHMQKGEQVVSCGASGAIYGLMGALAVMLIVSHRRNLMRAVPRFLIYVVLSLYSGSRDPSIDNAAHVGGFVGGIMICFVVCIIKRYREERVMK